MRTHPSRRRFVSAAVAAADDDAAAHTSSTPLEATDADASSEDPRPQGAVVWFRQDLRLDDNQAFRAAVRAANKRGGEVLCLFVWSPDEEGDDSSASWAPGGASRVWLHHSLASMDRDIRRRYGGGGVRFMSGAHAPAVAAAAAEVNATTVFASERYEPVHVQGDERTRRALAAKGIELVTLPGHLLFHRDKIRVDMEREKYFFGTLMPFVHAAEKCGGKPGAPGSGAPQRAHSRDADGFEPGRAWIDSRVGCKTRLVIRD
jgi:deoxyribodipyrimidine photolyase